jgi:hypothetical protein
MFKIERAIKNTLYFLQWKWIIVPTDFETLLNFYPFDLRTVR